MSLSQRKAKPEQGKGEARAVAVGRRPQVK